MKYIRKEIIGDCTLYLGDCQQVMPILGKVDAVVTDPPYGMNFVSNRRELETKFMPINNDNDSEMLRWATLLEARHSKYIFCRWNNLKDVLMPKSLITWVKNNHSMGDLEHEHGRRTEVILFYPSQGHFFPHKRPDDVIFANRTGNEKHPTQKPVLLMKQIIEWTAGVVLDPFMGSGTTGVACVEMGRKFTGVELDAGYFDIACKRIEEAYKQPKLFDAGEILQKKEQRNLIDI